MPACQQNCGTGRSTTIELVSCTARKTLLALRVVWSSATGTGIHIAGRQSGCRLWLRTVRRGSGSRGWPVQVSYGTLYARAGSQNLLTWGRLRAIPICRDSVPVWRQRCRCLHPPRAVRCVWYVPSSEKSHSIRSHGACGSIDAGVAVRLCGSAFQVFGLPQCIPQHLMRYPVRPVRCCVPTPRFLGPAALGLAPPR